MAKVIIIKCKMQDPLGKFIPKGLTEDLKIEIADNIATFRFNNSHVTQKFVYFEVEACKKKNKVCNTAYIPRVQKAITKYQGKTKEEIKEIIIDQLNKMGAKNVR